MRNRILHTFHYLQHFSKRLIDKLNKVYNPLNKLVRRIKDTMKRTEVGTALIMVTIPLSFFLGLASLHETNGLRTMLTLIGLALLLVSVLLWLWVYSQIKKEEAKEHTKGTKEAENMQTLIEEIKGLRQDIGGFLKNEKTKRTKGKAAKLKSRNKGTSR